MIGLETCGFSVVRTEQNASQFHGIRQGVNRVIASIALVTWMSATVIAGQAFAADKERSNVIEEIIVTAQKRETLLQDSPLTLNVLTAAMLRDSDVQNLSQLQFFVPGLTIGSESFGVLFIRGVGATNLGVGYDASSTLHVDGVYIPRLSGVYMDFWDVERIEVLKGPQGTLYGRNATGGTINIISKSPTDEFELSGGVTIGNYDKWRYDTSISGPISENITGRFTFMKNDRDGFQKDIEFDRRYLDEDTFALRGTLRFQLSDNAELFLRGDYLQQRESGQTFVEDQLDRPDDTYKVALDGPQRQDIDSGGASATLNVDLDQFLGGATWETLASWRKSDNELEFDNDASGLFKRNSRFPETTESLHFETRLVSSPDAGGRLEWIAGIFYFQEKAEDEFGRLTIPGGPNCAASAMPDYAICPATRFAFPEDNKTNAYAGFGQATYNVTDKLRLTAGIRYSHEKKKFNSNFLINGTSAAPGGLPIPEEASWSSWSPKYVVDYHINDNVMLWGNASKGFKSGSFSIASLGKGASDQETNWAYEVGVKSTLLDSRMVANLSVFKWDYDGLQIQGFDPERGFFLDNAGKASNDGVELEIFAKPNERWDINIAAAYLDAVFDVYLDPGSGVDRSGNKQPRSPEWTFSAGATYTTPVPQGDLSFRGEILWQDDYFYGIDNVFFSEAFALLNASIMFVPTADDRWTLALFAKNILDKEYYNGRYHNRNYSPNPDNSNQVVVGEPRQWGIRIRFDY